MQRERGMPPRTRACQHLAITAIVTARLSQWTPTQYTHTTVCWNTYRYTPHWTMEHLLHTAISIDSLLHIETATDAYFTVYCNNWHSSTAIYTQTELCSMQSYWCRSQQMVKEFTYLISNKYRKMTRTKLNTVHFVLIAKRFSDRKLHLNC